jgi:hypothetical protein
MDMYNHNNVIFKPDNVTLPISQPKGERIISTFNLVT